MTAEILSFDTGRPADLADGEPALVVDVEGYEGPLDLLLDAGAAAEGRPVEDLDPGARRSVSVVHRGGARRSASSLRPTIW